MFNRIEVIGKVYGTPSVEKGVVSFEIIDSRTNLIEVYKVVAFETMIEESVGGIDNLIEGLELLIQGPYKIKRDGANKQIVCGADAILPLGVVSTEENSTEASATDSEEEQEVEETHTEEKIEDEIPQTDAVSEENVPDFPPSDDAETPSTETRNDLSVEFNSTGEVENQTNCKMGEFGLIHPDSISLFEEPQPTNNTSSTQTPKQSGNSGKKGRFSVDDFRV